MHMDIHQARRSRKTFCVNNLNRLLTAVFCRCYLFFPLFSLLFHLQDLSVPDCQIGIAFKA